MAKKTQIYWITLLQAIGIIIVVIYHIQLIDKATGANHTFCSMISHPLIPIMMPLIFFISGGLLYISRIQNKYSIFALYKDKFIRLLLPFAFFITFYFLLKAALNGLVKTPVDISINFYIESFYLFYKHPSGHLWYLATLMTLMLFYPVYVFACRNKFAIFSLLAFAFIMYYCDLHVFFAHNYFNLANLNKYFIYFYLGIVFFRYKIYQYLNNAVCCIILPLAYVCLLYFKVDLITSVVGIFAATSLAITLCKSKRFSLSIIGNHIYQIYLLSFAFQAMVELLLWKRLFYNEDLFYLFYVINLLSGLFLPIAVVMIVKKCPYRFVRLCFGLK